MSPLLERETGVEAATRKKFVRIGTVIAFGAIGAGKHSDIALDYNIVPDSSGRPNVDDAGLTDQTYDGRLTFFSSSTSCNLQGDPVQQRQMTILVAKGILGDERVSSKVEL